MAQVPPPTVARDVEKLLDRFEQAWRSGSPPRIEEFLPAAAGSLRRKLLEELVKLDLEYRWRNCQHPTAVAQRLGPPPRLQDYVAKYPELARPEELALELIGEEYRARHRWGDRPGHPDYVARFAQYGSRLQQLLKQIDAELSAERPAKPLAPAAQSPPVDPVQPVRSIAELRQALQRCPLLSAAQLEEVTRDIPVRFTDARALARELLQKGWLTPYQVNQLFLGQASQLLLGPYLLLERLGEGGAGQVFKARHRQLDRVVALKLIRKELLADSDVVRRFEREMQVTSQLDHPNVVHAHDAGLIGSAYFLAMEYVEGTDLARVVKQSGPLAVERACDYMRQAARGLQHAHAQGLVHRDIKPHNLFLSTAGPGLGTIKILDLGLARLHQTVHGELTTCLNEGQASSLTPIGAVMMGTADYIAPEQALEFHKADIRADIYSLGCTFFYLLTGQPPFPGGTLAQKIARHLQAEAPALDEVRPEVPQEVAVVLRTMLAKRPEDRYQTPAEVVQALDAVLAGSARRPWKLRSWVRHCRPRPLLAGALLALVLLLGFFVLRSDPSPLDRLNAWYIPMAKRTSGQPKELVAILSPPMEGGSATPSVVFSPDGKMAASYAGDRRNWLWRFDGARPPEPVAVSSGSHGRLAIGAREGRVLLGANDDFCARIFDVGGSAPKLWAELPGVRNLAFSRDGQMVASCGPNAIVQTWSIEAHPPKLRANIAAKNAEVKAIQALAFAPDGKTLAGGGATLYLWDLSASQPRERFMFPDHNSGVQAIAYGPDGKTLAFSSAHEIRVLENVTRSEPRLRFLLQEHKSAVQSIAFAPDGRSLASAGDDGLIAIWDAQTGTKRISWQFAGPIRSLAYAPDGRHLALTQGGSDVLILRLGN